MTTISPNDPLAKAIQGARGEVSGVVASVNGELFRLDRWTLHRVPGSCCCAEDDWSIETDWTPLRDVVKRWTIPLRLRLQMKLMYWRQKVFG